MDIYEKLEKYTEYSIGKSRESCELLFQEELLTGIDFSKYDLNNSFFLEVILATFI